MSVVNSIFAQGERGLLAAGHGDLLTVLRGVDVGKEFTCRMDVEPMNQQEYLLGLDMRMQTIARFLAPAPKFARGDKASVNGVRYSVDALRDNNASSITIDYVLHQDL
jgi:hypothetical protein